MEDDMASIQITHEPAQKWECGDCGDLHDCDLDALECCKEIHEVWVCPICDDKHDTRDDALNCAAADLDASDGIIVVATPLELEAAGQLRLLP